MPLPSPPILSWIGRRKIAISISNRCRRYSSSVCCLAKTRRQLRETPCPSSTPFAARVREKSHRKASELGSRSRPNRSFGWRPNWIGHRPAPVVIHVDVAVAPACMDVFAANACPLVDRLPRYWRLSIAFARIHDLPTQLGRSVLNNKHEPAPAPPCDLMMAGRPQPWPAATRPNLLVLGRVRLCVTHSSPSFRPPLCLLSEQTATSDRPTSKAGGRAGGLVERRPDSFPFNLCPSAEILGGSKWHERPPPASKQGHSQWFGVGLFARARAVRASFSSAAPVQISAGNCSLGHPSCCPACSPVGQPARRSDLSSARLAE